LAVFEN